MAEISGLTRAKVKPKQITTFTLDEEKKEKLWDIADANDCALSDVIRYAIDQFFKKLENKTD